MLLLSLFLFFFFFTDTATTEIYTLSLHDALPILVTGVTGSGKSSTLAAIVHYINQHYRKHILTIEDPIEFLHEDKFSRITQDRKSTRLNSSHGYISYAVFCLKKKTKQYIQNHYK